MRKPWRSRAIVCELEAGPRHGHHLGVVACPYPVLLLHPLDAAVLVVFGGPAAAVFTLLHGAGNGLRTVAKGTLPLALFGPAGYGLRTGLLSAPARVAQAGAPLLFGFLLDQVGLGVMAVSASFGLASTAALLALHSQPTSHQPKPLNHPEHQGSNRFA